MHGVHSFQFTVKILVDGLTESSILGLPRKADHLLREVGVLLLACDKPILVRLWARVGFCSVPEEERAIFDSLVVSSLAGSLETAGLLEFAMEIVSKH